MTTRVIRSKDNAQFKQLKRLAESARERRAHGRTVLDGVHVLTALADANGTLEALIVREDAEAHADIAACIARFADVERWVLDTKLFDAFSPVETPTGIAGVFAIPQPAPRESHCAIMLENIQDPGNLGSIIRTAAAAGADTIFLSPGCADAWSPKAVRAGMGAHFALNIFEQQNLQAQAAQFPIVVATTLHNATSLYDVDLRTRAAFIFGNEGAGLSEPLLAAATHRVTIPMPGKVESLNVAAAVAVCLFERVRQRQLFA